MSQGRILTCAINCPGSGDAKVAHPVCKEEGLIAGVAVVAVLNGVGRQRGYERKRGLICYRLNGSSRVNE